MYIKGLEGVEAAESKVSFIDGKHKGGGILLYAGYNINDIIKKTSFEEIVYLLWNNNLPDKNQLNKIKKDLKKERKVDNNVIKFMKSLPKNSNSMGVLRTCVSMLAFYDKESENNSIQANRRKAIKLVAKIPTIIAAWERIKKGKQVINPNNNLDHAANFLYMLFGKKPDEASSYVFDKWMILHGDHTLNASTFSSRVTSSTLSDIYSAITSAIGTLKGPLHGGANQKVMKMLLEIKEEKNVKKYIDGLIKRHERIMGIGHRVYKTGDPRAKILKELGIKLGMRTGGLKWLIISEQIEKISLEKIKMYPNVDFYSASVLYNLGFPVESFPPLFAAGRIAGWTAHVLEQYQDNRLIRPKVIYSGQKNRKFVEIDKR